MRDPSSGAWLPHAAPSALAVLGERGRALVIELHRTGGFRPEDHGDWGDRILPPSPREVSRLGLLMAVEPGPPATVRLTELGTHVADLIRAA